MKVLMINGSPHKEGNTYLALKEMENIFLQEGIECEIVQVGNKPVRGCIGCRACGEKGKCVFDDCVNETAPKFQECDGLFIMHQQTAHWFPSLTVCSSARPLIKP